MIAEELRAASRAGARLSKALEVALTEVGLSLPQYRLLVYLSGGSERATVLAGRLDVSPPSLTALVDGAVSRGLVERRASDDDRRAVRHEVTAAGQSALSEGDAAIAAALERFLGHLTAPQARKVVEGLELLGQAMDAARAASPAGSR